jgi:hypothetical protein
MSRCREGRTRAGTGTEVGSAIRLVGGPDDDDGVGPRGIREDGWDLQSGHRKAEQTSSVLNAWL